MYVIQIECKKLRLLFTYCYVLHIVIFYQFT